MNQEIKSNYQITVSDLLEAEQLNQRQFSKLGFNVMFLLLMLWSLFLEVNRLQDPDFMIVGYFQQQSIEQSSDDFWTNIIFYSATFFLFLGEIFPKLNPLYRRNIARRYQNNFVKREPKQISISPSRLTITSQNFRQSMQWHGFYKLLENQKIFLLYYGRDSEATIIPKRIFQEQGELEYFRELVTTNLKQLNSR